MGQNMSFGEYGSQKDVEIERLREECSDLRAKWGYTESIQTLQIERLCEALAPFAVIGGLLNMVSVEAMPNDVSASRLKLDGLEARHFREAHTVLRSISSPNGIKP